MNHIGISVEKTDDKYLKYRVKTPIDSIPFHTKDEARMYAKGIIYGVENYEHYIDYLARMVISFTDNTGEDK